MSFPFLSSKQKEPLKEPLQSPYTPLEVRKGNINGKMLLAAYDSAQTTGRNARHWQWSDNLSADAANSKEVRKVIRERARYEFANNSYCHGMVQTLANGVVGTGPVLQMRIDDEGLNKDIEDIFEIHTRAIKFARKLRTLKKAKTRDGEAFAQFVSRKVKNSPLSIDIVPVECDRVTDPSFSFLSIISENNIDGVIIDNAGEPVQYKVLRYHPGDNILGKIRDMFTADPVRAEYMLHWFREDRPEQHRGICEFQSAMPLFSILRDYTMATLTAAQQAALLATVIQSTNSPEIVSTNEQEGETDPEPMDTFSLEQGMSTVLPKGWALAQMKAEQPVGTFTEFEKTILRQISRALCMPFNIAAGDSSGYNYASGRLDHQDFFRFLQVERQDMQDYVIDPFTIQFLKELVLLPDFRRYKNKLLPERYGVQVLPPHEWYFSDYKHVDPAKEANAFSTLRKAKGITLATWYAGQGKDWRTEIEQIGIEKKYMLEQGIDDSDIEKNIVPQTENSKNSEENTDE